MVSVDEEQVKVGVEQKDGGDRARGLDLGKGFGSPPWACVQEEEGMEAGEERR